MHIIIGLLSTLSLLAIVLIRANHAANAVEELSGRSRGWTWRVRHKLFGHKIQDAPLSDIEDPREGVLALMAAVMKDEGDLTEEQIKDLEHWAEKRLNYSNPEEMVALARWRVRNFVESGAVLYRLHKKLATLCNGEQRADVIELVEAAAASSGTTLSRLQQHTIVQLKYYLGDVHQLTVRD